MSRNSKGRPVNTPTGDSTLAQVRRVYGGLSQQAAASLLGLSQAQVSKIERGEQALVGSAKACAEALLTIAAQKRRIEALESALRRAGIDPGGIG